VNEPVVINDLGRPDNRRVKKMAIVGLLTLLFVGVVLPKVFFGGGGGGPAPASDLPPSESAAPTAAGAGAGDVVVEHVGSFSTKNPFTPLVGSAGGATPAPPVASTPVLPVDPEPVTVVDLPDPMDDPVADPDPAPPARTPPTTAVPAPAPAPAPTPRPLRTFVLADVIADDFGLLVAHVTIDGISYAAAQGQDFAGSYRVLTLDGAGLCGIFLYGDQRFSLCPGETTTT
jgi:hypothetical protein